MTNASSKSAAKKTSAGIVSSAQDLAGQVGAISATLAESIPDAAESVRGSAMDVYHSVESMPRAQQRTLTRTSLGVGAALFVLGAPRLVTFVAFLPALAIAGVRLAKRAR